MAGDDAVAVRGREERPEPSPASVTARAHPTSAPTGGRPPGPGHVLAVLGRTTLGLLLAPLAAVAAAAAAAVRRPSALVALMLIMICVPVQADVGGSVVGIGDVTSVLLVLAAGFGTVRDRRAVNGVVAAAFGALVLAASAATLAAADPVGSLVGWVRYVQLFVLVPLAVLMATRSRQDAVLIGHAVILAALVEGAIGTWQYVTGTGASYAGESVRAVGTFGADDVIAMSTVVGLGLVVALGFALGAAGRRRPVYAAVAAALVVPLGLSLSRGSWIATAVAALVVLLCAGVRTFLVALALTAAVGTVVVGGFGVGSQLLAERVASITSSVGSPDSSVSDRYDLWQTAVAIWVDHPVTGVGIKAFPEFRDGYAPLGLSSGSDVEQAGRGFHVEELLSPHNQYLLVLSEQGLLGGSAFAVLVLGLAVGAVVATRRSVPPDARGVRYAIVGLTSWQVVQFSYGDLGGAASLMTSVVLGLGASALVARRSSAPRPAPAPAPGARGAVPAPKLPRRGVLARAAVVTAVLAGVGSAFGLVRDLLVAALFGATAATDAFVVAWTIPETFAPLLIEGTMAMVMVPAFGRAIAAAEERRRDALPGPRTDPVRELIEGTLPRMVLALVAAGALLAAGAPWLVHVLAPGLADPDLAARCMRAVAVTVPLMGLAGYLAAALRTYQRFGAAASIYLAYNGGIIATMLLTYQYLGVVGAAVGIAVGAALMVLVQLPAALARVPLPRAFSVRRSTAFLTLGAVVPVACYSINRQAQTFVERFAASPLAEGTISHLNYAQKIAQIPITLAFMAAAVTFPVFARSVASGRHDDARRRMEIDVLVVGGIAVLVTAYLWVFAPAVVATLFERGAFTAQDTARTASILRAYALGLAGQALVSLLVRPYFTHPGAIWRPAIAMLVGLGATVAGTLVLVGPYGAVGIALANALGISVTALILIGQSRTALPMAPAAQAYGRLGLLLVPAVVALALASWWRELLQGSAAPVVAVSGGVLVLACFAAFLLLHRWLSRAAAGTRHDKERQR